MSPSERELVAGLDSVYQIPAAVRVLLVLSDALPLYVVFLVFVAMPRDNPFYSLAALCSVGLSSLVLLFAGRWARWFGMVSALAVGSLCSVALYHTSGLATYGWGAGILVIGGLIRTVLWMRTSDVTEHNRQAFRVDTACVTLAVAGYLMFSTDGAAKTTLELTVLSSAALLMRIFSLWMLTRMESLILGPIKTWLVLAIFGASGLLLVVLTLLYTAVGLMAAVQGGLLFLLIWLFPNFKLKMPTSPLSKIHAGMPKPSDNLPAGQTAGHVFVLVVGCIVVFALVAILLRLLRHKREEPQATAEAAAVLEAQTARSWLKRLGGLKFVTTTDPVRLAFQAWLTQEYKQGRGIQPSETARQYQSRAVQDAGANNLPQLFASYERARYEDGMK